MACKMSRDPERIKEWQGFLWKRDMRGSAYNLRPESKLLRKKPREGILLGGTGMKPHSIDFLPHWGSDLMPDSGLTPGRRVMNRWSGLTNTIMSRHIHTIM